MHVVVKVPVTDVEGFAVYETVGLESISSVAEQEQVIISPRSREVGVQENERVGEVASTTSKIWEEYPPV